MAIEFNGADSYAAFEETPPIQNLTTLSVLSWFNPDGMGEGGSGRVINNTQATGGFWQLQTQGTNQFSFGRRWSGAVGLWYSNTNILATGVMNFVAVTYDASSVNNDPIFYYGGSSVSLTENTTPSGTLVDDSSANIILGTNFTGELTFDGKIYSACVYNRILSAQEILDAYNSKLSIPTHRGLVFAPNLAGAAGGVTDGSALATANEITCAVSGARGVPSGSPLIRADDYLIYE